MGLACSWWQVAWSCWDSWSPDSLQLYSVLALSAMAGLLLVTGAAASHMCSWWGLGCCEGCCGSSNSTSPAHCLPTKWVELDTYCSTAHAQDSTADWHCTKSGKIFKISQLDVMARLSAGVKRRQLLPINTVNSLARRQHWGSVTWFFSCKVCLRFCAEWLWRQMTPQSWQLGNAQCCSWQLETVQENLHYKENTST